MNPLRWSDGDSFERVRLRPMLDFFSLLDPDRDQFASSHPHFDHARTAALRLASRWQIESRLTNPCDRSARSSR